jgi:hypothetical protein
MPNRREHVPFDPHYFQKKKEEGHSAPIDEVFRHIHETNLWNGPDSVSGAGASRTQIEELQRRLPSLLKELAVEVFLDLPCGDFSWMRFIELPVSQYIGADIVPELVTRHQAESGNEQRRFQVLDLTSDRLPEADLLLCRDCLVHLSFADIRRSLANIKNSGIKYLLTTTFPQCDANEDIVTGDWRLLNLRLPPFNFPPPLELINERCTEGDGLFRDKSLGLWLVSDIPETSNPQ